MNTSRSIILKSFSDSCLKYPWEALVFNRLKVPCDTTTNLYKDNHPDGVNYDICSGSLISNKHILTSAECLLTNKEILLSSYHNEKIRAEYSDATCIFVFLGFADKNDAINNGELRRIKERYVHSQAFTDISEFNYNLGKHK